MPLGDNAAGPALIDGGDPAADSRLRKTQHRGRMGYVPDCRNDTVRRFAPIFNLSHDILFYGAGMLA